MEIQWPLALFTLFTAMGGCLFVFVGINEFTKKSQTNGFTPALIAVILAIVGGLCSVLHLEHVERIMNALSRPTSGIFIEAVLIGCLVICIAIYLLCLKRELSAGVKVFAVLGIVFGLALSFMAGHSYVMIAIASWNTLLLPTGYLFTALPMGATLYWVLAAKTDEAGSFMAKCTIVSGILAFLGSLMYAIASGAFVGGAAAVAVLSIILSGIVPAAIGYLALRKYGNSDSDADKPAKEAVVEASSTEEKADGAETSTETVVATEASSGETAAVATSKYDKLKVEIWIAFGSAVIGALLYRVLMWLMYASDFGFFGANF